MTMLHDPGGKVRLAVADGIITDASFSPCQRYRYRLERRLETWKPGDRSVLFILMNPSTADTRSDDPTVRRCWNFARSWGYGRMLLCNVMAYRATHPKMLLALGDPTPCGMEALGADNTRAVLVAAKEADEIICAWGAVNRRLRAYADRVECSLRAIGWPLFALALTKEGEPAHPLYLPRDLTPSLWNRKAPSHG